MKCSGPAGAARLDPFQLVLGASEHPMLAGARQTVAGV